MNKFKEKGHGYFHFINEKKTLNLAAKLKCHIFGVQISSSSFYTRLSSTQCPLLPNALPTATPKIAETGEFLGPC